MASPIERYGESAGVIAPGAAVANTDYTPVATGGVFAVQRFVATKKGQGDLFLEEIDPDGAIVKRIPVYFAAAGTIDLSGIHFRVARGNTVRVWDISAAPSETFVYWQGALQ